MNNMEESILVIADNQYLTAIGIKLLAEKTGHFDKIVDAANKDELQQILEKNKTNVIEVVLDFDLFDFENANEFTTFFKTLKNVYFLFIGDHFTEEVIHLLAEVLSANIILKSTDLEELSIALNLTSKGRRYIHSEILDLLMNSNTLNATKATAVINSQLTSTEKEIAFLIVQGKTTKEIASIRNLSYHTIVTHRKNIFRKLEINSVYELTKYAMRIGLIDPAEYYI